MDLMFKIVWDPANLSQSLYEADPRLFGLIPVG
jgi:hypothetical protein